MRSPGTERAVARQESGPTVGCSGGHLPDCTSRVRVIFRFAAKSALADLLFGDVFSRTLKKHDLRGTARFLSFASYCRVSSGTIAGFRRFI
jgi:hypothetical protein